MCIVHTHMCAVTKNRGVVMGYVESKLVVACDGCTHGGSVHKQVHEMNVCAKARAYIQLLVDAGDWLDNGCEQCVIEYVCEDPIEHCMNGDDGDSQWWTQCVRPRNWWKRWLTMGFNDALVLESVEHQAFVVPWITSMYGVMAKHKLVITIL